MDLSTIKPEGSEEYQGPERELPVAAAEGRIGEIDMRRGPLLIGKPRQASEYLDDRDHERGDRVVYEELPAHGPP